MLRQTPWKRRNSIGKMSKNKNFNFFQNDPKLNKNDLQDLEKPRKTFFSVFRSILDEN